MRDSFGRHIDYLRVSVTDRCNLRCRYCMPEELPSVPHELILRYEEILRVCAIMATLGIRTVKVTGGEPLVRKGCLDFIKRLKQIPGIEHVTLTTNGVLLEPYIDDLASLGLDGINISLDSLDAHTYTRITGRDELNRARRSLYKAVESGLRVKINCVPLRGINEGDILPIAYLAKTLPVDVRFIELMAAGAEIEGIPGAEVIDKLRHEFPDLHPDPAPHGFGPARYFKSGGLVGSIGLIASVSGHFCSGCNRVRLTNEGFLKLCLVRGEEIDLRELLRFGAGDGEIRDKIEAAIHNKPERHLLNEGESIEKMSRIGG